MTESGNENRRIAIITGDDSLGAVALAGLIAAGITPVHISEPLDRDDWLMGDLNRVPGPLEISMLDWFRPRPRRHDERQRFDSPIHQRLFKPIAAPEHFTITEKPLTKRQRRRMKGKQA